MMFWPQILVATFFAFLLVGAAVKHGDRVTDEKISFNRILWCVFTFAAVLGAGGFWTPR